MEFLVSLKLENQGFIAFAFFSCVLKQDDLKYLSQLLASHLRNLESRGVYNEQTYSDHSWHIDGVFSRPRDIRHGFQTPKRPVRRKCGQGTVQIKNLGLGILTQPFIANLIGRHFGVSAV